MTLIQNDLQLISMLHLIKSDILSKIWQMARTLVIQTPEVFTSRNTMKYTESFFKNVKHYLSCTYRSIYDSHTPKITFDIIFS